MGVNHVGLSKQEKSGALNVSHPDIFTEVHDNPQSVSVILS